MANIATLSVGWKFEDAGDGFKKITMSAGDLRKIMQANVEEADKLSKKVINFAAICTSVDSLSNTFNSLKSVVSDLTAAYDVQAVAESRLKEVMRNTMEAREEDIQSIKDFCSAQQQIGVVGDEVQLAGAQELATYLEFKSSLKALIPVMNDMLVQQNGLVSSGENAAQIATMLGKVMEGQTGALSRYGYKFDDAQEKILKYGTEAERVAVLVDVVSASVGGMNRALARTPAGHMQQIKNNLGDIKEVLGGYVKGAEPILTIGANATIALGGVMKLVTGLKTLSTTLHLTKAAAGWIGLALTVVAGAVTYLVASADDGADSLDRLKTAEERAAEAAERMADAEETAADARKAAASSIELNIAKLKNFNGTKEEEKKLVKEMNNTYGETMGYFKSVVSWYQALVKNSKAYCEQMVAEAKARKYADRIAELEVAREAIARDEEGNQKKYSTERRQVMRQLSKQEVEEEKRKGNEVYGQHVGGKYIQYAWMEEEGSSDIEKAQANYNDYTKQIESLKNKIQAETKRIDMPVMGSSVLPNDGGGSKVSSQSAKNIKETAPDGSIQNVRDQISDINKKVTYSTDPDEIFHLEREKISLQKRLKELELPIKIAGSKEKLEEMWKDIKPIGIDVEVNTDNLTQDLRELPEILSPAEKLQKTLGNVSDVASAAGNAFRGMGQAFNIPALDVVGIIAGAIATMAQGFAQASLESSFMGPIAWAAFSLSGLAQLTSMISQVKSVSAFADGGVVYGPTLGLVGEYAGARSNPEVIAPLNKLRDIIGDRPGAAPVVVGGRIELSGRTLRLLLHNESMISGMSGNKKV